MANKILWSAETPVSIMTTELNSLPDGNISISPEINASNNQFIQIELKLSNVVKPATDPYCELHLLSAMDGIYPLHTSAKPPLPQYLIGAFNFHEDGEEVSILSNIFIPFSLFKLVITNRVGVNLASSGNVLKYQLGTSEVQ